MTKPDKQEWILRNLRDTFAKAQMSSNKNLTNKALVTPTPDVQAITQPTSGNLMSLAADTEEITENQAVTKRSVGSTTKWEILS